MRERLRIEQGENSSTGSSNSSHHSGEDTARFFQTPANSGTAINTGNKHDDNYGNEDEQSDFEGARSFDRRPKAYTSFNESGMDEASTDPDTSTRRGAQDLSLKCQVCLREHRVCDQAKPRCSACVKRGRACDPEDNNMHGTLVGGKCLPCRRDSLRCNGEEPCNTCIKRNRSCYKEKLIPGAIKCMHCKSQKFPCDGAAPCGTCMRQRMMVCRHLDDDGLIEWHYDTTSTPKDVYGDCLGCVRYERLLVGPVKVPCDRQRPCNNCMVKPHAKNCCYQVEECLQMVIPKGENTSTGHKRETKRTN